MADLDRASGFFRPAQQFFEVVWRQRCRSCQGRCRGVDEADRCEILDGIKRELRIKRHARRQRDLMNQDRIAVWLGARGAGGGNHAASAADIFDHDGLAERFLQRALHDARNGVGRAAGREGHQQGDGPVRIILCRSNGCEKTCNKKNCGEKHRRKRAGKYHDPSPRGRLSFYFCRGRLNCRLDDVFSCFSARA